MTSTPPFRADHYHLQRASAAAPDVRLEPVAAAAVDLGRAFAAIDPWASYPYTAEALTTYFENGERHAPRYAIRLGDRIAGVVGLRIDWLRGPYLQFLGILPEFQRHGLGTIIVDWLVREAGPTTKNLWVCASDFNIAAIRFYERHGFQRIAILDDLVQEGRNEVLMRRRLG